MDNLFLPGHIDNDYRGHKLALWLFWIVVITRGLQGILLLIDGDSIVRDADGIPLDSFPAAAAQSLVTLFVLSGASRLVLSLLCALAFFRYRSSIPLMLALLALDQVAKEVLLYFYPPYRVGNPIGPVVNQVLLFLTLIGLVLSIWGKRKARA